MTIDNSRTVNMALLDEIVQNERTSATASNPLGVLYMTGNGLTPASVSSATGGTLTSTQIDTGIIVITSTAAAQTFTLDTATNILAKMNARSAGITIGDVMQVLIINGGAANAFTLANGTGGSNDANQANVSIAAGSSRLLNLRFTNVTTAPAYVAYF